MFRRVFLVAFAMLLLGAAPASAQDAYANILGEGDRTGTVVVGEAGPAFADTGSTFDELARTGSDQTLPMAQAAIVLMGGGAMLLLVARRRRAQRDSTPA